MRRLGVPKLLLCKNLMVPLRRKGEDPGVVRSMVLAATMTGSSGRHSRILEESVPRWKGERRGGMEVL
jgi:hypothetical protein